MGGNGEDLPQDLGYVLLDEVGRPVGDEPRIVVSKGAYLHQCLDQGKKPLTGEFFICVDWKGKRVAITEEAWDNFPPETAISSSEQTRRKVITLVPEEGN